MCAQAESVERQVSGQVTSWRVDSGKMMFARSLLFVVCFGLAYSLGGYRHGNRQIPSAYSSRAYEPHHTDFTQSNTEQQSEAYPLESLLTGTEAGTEAGTKAWPENGGCFGKGCAPNDKWHKCCPGATCVDMVECAQQGYVCVQDGDCAPSLVCLGLESGGTIIRTCQSDRQRLPRKLYNEQCVASGECNVQRGMCCQIQRRHRQAPRKVCIYFKDPKDCINDDSPFLDSKGTTWALFHKD